MNTVTDDVVKERLAWNIGTCRRVQRMTQQGLADAMTISGFGWNQRVVSEVERGVRHVLTSELAELSCLFHVSIDLLVNGLDEIDRQLEPQRPMRSRGGVPPSHDT